MSHTCRQRSNMASRSTWKCRRNRRIRQPVFRNAVMILSLLQTIHAFLFTRPLAPCQRFSNGKHPLVRERIRNDSGTQTLLKEGIGNYNNIDHSYNKIGNNDPNGPIPAHEKIFSVKKMKSRTGDGTGTPFDASPLSVPNAANVAPLKVMLFIDGTWLYYSMYKRDFKQDIITQKLGSNWMYDATPDWSSLPAVACQALLRDPKAKWSSIGSIDDAASSRPIEVSRVSVYSSMHPDTPTDSFRYKMFEDMVKAGFDVNMMETRGKGEKGVDIQLAVDMLYYATVPDAYDVALLLTGDRDFLPAVIRCRQKGRRVGLVSMRTGSMSFEETPNLKDYDTIWLEDYLPQWIKKNPEATEKRKEKPIIKPKERPRKQSPQISSYTLNKVITNFISKSGETLVSSRDMGRHLKALSVSGRPLLDDIKAVYGGLYQFLILSKIYLVLPDSRRAEKGFWVARFSDKIEENGQEKLMLNPKEESFLETYEQWMPVDKNTDYYFTTQRPDPASQQSTNQQNLEDNSSSVDYNVLTIQKLKEICREKGLKVSASKKIELVERIEEHLKSENMQEENTSDEKGPVEYLKSLVLEYLHASGGRASSRDVGRYLAANKGSTGRNTSALAELKETYGNLNVFIKQVPCFFVVPGPDGGHEFNVCLDKDLIEQQKLR